MTTTEPVMIMTKRPSLAATAGLLVVGVAAGTLDTPAVMFVIWAACLVLAARVDALTLRLPDRIVAPGAGLMVGYAIGSEAPTGWGIVGGAIMLGLPFLIAHLVTPAGVGFGDVKFAALVGAGLGAETPRLTIAALLMSIVVHVVVQITRPWPIQRRQAGSAPYGPSLVIATAATLAIRWFA